MSLLVAVCGVLVLIVSGVFCEAFYGRGTIYVSPLQEDEETIGLQHLIVYRPQKPDEYARKDRSGSLSTVMSNERRTTTGLYSMKWDEYGQYFYSKTLPNSMTENDYPLTFEYGVKLTCRGIPIYIDEKHTHSTLTSHMRYCVLDAQQEYDYEYNCSRALADELLKTTTETYTPYPYDSGKVPAYYGGIIASVSAVVVASIAIAVLAILKKRGCGRTRSEAPVRSEDVEHSPSHPINRASSTDSVPPPYDTAVSEFPPDHLTNNEQDHDQLHNSAQ